MTLDEIKSKDHIRLYAGDIVPFEDRYDDLIGLSLTRDDNCHTICNLVDFPLLFEDNSVDFFQSEDVFEHIEYELLPQIFDEIYRILKPNSLFRLSVPDYHCDVLYKRSIYDYEGNIVFDPHGGGTFEKQGHVWFPTFDNIKNLIKQTKFQNAGKVEYLHYWIDKNNFVVDQIDYLKGYIRRTPDNDDRVKNPYRPMSIVVDLQKGF